MYISVMLISLFTKTLPARPQNLPNTALHMLLYGLQPFLRPVDGRMPGKLEPDQAAKLLRLRLAHDLSANTLKGNIPIRGKTRFRVFVQMGDVVPHGIIEQRKPVVEDGRRSDDRASL